MNATGDSLNGKEKHSLSDKTSDHVPRLRLHLQIYKKFLYFCQMNCNQTSFPGKRRLFWLDLAKAVMLVPVILEHTEASFMWEWSDNFMLAVFWMSAGITSKPDFSIARKVRSLLLPYLVMNMLCLIFTWAYMGVPFEWRQLGGVVYGRYKMWAVPVSESNPCLMDSYNSVLWFLPSLFTAYIVFGLLVKVKGSLWNICAIAACVGITLLFRLQPFLLPWSLDTAPLFGSVIYCGRLLKLNGVFEHKTWIWLLTGLPLYVGANYLTGATNISVGDFGQSVLLWFVAATSGATAFIAFCRMSGDSCLSKTGAWFNIGALFIFGMQLVFYKWAMIAYDPWHIESWKIRTIIVLIFCFTGGKILAWIYSRVSRRLVETDPM